MKQGHPTKEAAISSVRWIAIERWTNRGVSTGVVLLLARLLGPEAFGIIGVAQLVIAFCEMFVSSGLGFALVQRKDITEGHVSSVFWCNTVVGAVFALALALSSGIIADVCGKEALKPVVMILSLSLFVSGLSRTPAALLTREMKFKALAIRSAVSTTCGGVVAVSCAFIGAGVYSLVAQSLTAAIVSLVVLWKATSWRPDTNIRFRELKEMFSYGIKVLVDQIVLFFAKRYDEIVVAGGLGIEALGLYGILKKVSLLIGQLLVKVPGTAAFAIFARLQSDRDRMKYAVCTGLEAAVIIIAPICLCAAVLGHPMLSAIVGGKWQLPPLVLPLVVCAVTIEIVPSILHAALHSSGHPGIVMVVNLARCILSVGFLWVGVHFGLLGVALAVLGREVLGACMDCAAVTKTIRWNWYDVSVRPLRLALLATTGSLGVYFGFQCLLSAAVPEIAAKVVGLIISIVIYVLVVKAVLSGKQGVAVRSLLRGMVRRAPAG